jgi:hypothetical protein
VHRVRFPEPSAWQRLQVDDLQPGVGSRLLRELQAEASVVRKALRIHVERFNPALSLYGRLGFRLVEDRGVYLFLEWSPPSAVAATAAQENTAS